MVSLNPVSREWPRLERLSTVLQKNYKRYSTSLIQHLTLRNRNVYSHANGPGLVMTSMRLMELAGMLLSTSFGLFVIIWLGLLFT